MAQILLNPIGVIHTPFKTPAEAPIQASRSYAEGWAEVYPEYTQGLQDIEAFSHVFLIYHLHKATETRLLVEPFLDDQVHGVYATRHPARPNHIGISVVRLLSRQENRLLLSGVDMLDETPLLDIKPYLPDFDQRDGVQVGWYNHRSRV